jgi:hypothetical protein
MQEINNAVSVNMLPTFRQFGTFKKAWTGPEGSRRLRLPDFKTIGT